MAKLTTKTATTAAADLYEAGTTDRQDIIMALMGKGYSLNMATNGYAQFARDNGLTAKITSHKEEALEYLRDTYTEADWDADAVAEAAEELANRFEVADSTARDYCKAYSDELDVDHPVKNPREAIFEWFKAQDGEADKDAFMAFAKSIGRSQSNANEYWKGYELHLYLSK